MRKSKYYPILRELLKKPSFSVEEAFEAGIPRHALAEFKRSGQIERIAKKTYRGSSSLGKSTSKNDELVLMTISLPNSIICLKSALFLYGLIKEVPSKHWLAIPQPQTAPKSRLIKALRMSDTTTGLTTTQIGEYELPIFDRERCIVDAFRFLEPKLAFRFLQYYIQDKNHKPNLKTLANYGKKLRKDLKPYIELLTP